MTIVAETGQLYLTRQVPGHFAERHFAERHFAERTFCRMDILPNGHAVLTNGHFAAKIEISSEL